jgi:phosphohistidine phosphatase
MDLILWRHAEAEDGLPDIERELTHRGRDQANAMAAWLRKQLPSQVRVISSPAKRALQTARALTGKFEIIDSVAPGASVEAVIDTAQWPQASEAVVLVGHQPTLGQTAAFLLSGKALPWSIKKGGLCWLRQRSRDGVSQTLLYAAIHPGLLD